MDVRNAFLYFVRVVGPGASLLLLCAIWLLEKRGGEVCEGEGVEEGPCPWMKDAEYGSPVSVKLYFGRKSGSVLLLKLRGFDWWG